MTTNMATTMPDTPLRGLAVFLDLDGTLAAISPTPDQAHVPESTIRLLERLQRSCQGALAIVSGRDSADIGRMLFPLRLPYAALHGALLKAPDGQMHCIEVPSVQLAEMIRYVQTAALSLPGVIVERKSLSVALHYRSAPRLQTEILQLATEALAGNEAAFEIQKGKMVVEIKPRGASKARAIARFMSMPPFQGRIPLMAGDDLTDEGAFSFVNAMNGYTLKIGTGPSQAHWRLDDPPALSAWLNDLLAREYPADAGRASIKDKK